MDIINNPESKQLVWIQLNWNDFISTKQIKAWNKAQSDGSINSWYLLIYFFLHNKIRISIR